MKTRMLTLICLVFSACPRPVPKVVDVRDVSAAGGPPTIVSITDLAIAGLDDRAPLVLDRGDGVAVIGELLLLRGDDFGKQPTTTIGGAPARVIAHVAGGGVVVRVPWGIDPGALDVELTNERGRHSVKYPVRRLLLTTSRDGVSIASLDAGGRIARLSSVALSGADRIDVSTAGGWALIAGGSPPRLRLLDLTASKPTIKWSRPLPGKRAVALSVAPHRPLAVAVTDDHVTYIDLRRPANPALYMARAIPAALVDQRVIAGAISPAAKYLALLLAEKNQVAIFDASDPTALPAPKVVDALANSRLEVAMALRFSADAKALWVLSGNNPRSISGGEQPTLVSVITIGGGEHGSLEEPPTKLGDAGSPIALAVTRGEPTPPATSIRTAPASASALFVAAMASELLEPGKRERPAVLGKLLRSEPGKAPVVIASGAWVPGSADVAGKTAMILALGRKGEKRVIISRRAWGRDEVKITPIGEAKSQGPAPVGQLRLQP